MSNITFSSIITPKSVVFNTIDGKMHNITNVHKNYDKIVTAIKEYQAANKNNDSEKMKSVWESMSSLVDIGQTISAKGKGKVTVSNGVVMYDGQAVHNTIADRILWGIGDGFDMDSYMMFLDNLMDNPSMRSITQLYGFMEANNMGITDDGHLIAYKRVRHDFKDIYTGTISNAPGEEVTMPRNQVMDDPNATCSSGLHACSMSYLPHFGSSRDSYDSEHSNKIVLVKINPRDVVSIPVDHKNAKLRCCRYVVLSEYTGSDVDDLLSSKAVWSDRDFYSYDDSDDYYENDDEYYDSDDDYDYYDDEDEYDEQNDDLDQYTSNDNIDISHDLNLIVQIKTKSGDVFNNAVITHYSETEQNITVILSDTTKEIFVYDIVEMIDLVTGEVLSGMYDIMEYLENFSESDDDTLRVKHQNMIDQVTIASAVSLFNNIEFDDEDDDQ